MTTVSVEKEAQLAALHELMSSRHIQGYWESRGESSTIEPHLWPWKDIYECIEASSKVITIASADQALTFGSVGPGGESIRRAHGMWNPSMGGQRKQPSPTLSMGVQAVLPGEVARAHRHTMSALRFVIQSDGGGSTTSDGEQMFMEEGDLLVQPNWTWHDHANNGKQAVMWIDILDAYLVHLLGARFHENLGSDAQLTDRPANFSNDHYGVVRNGEEIDTNPPYRYKWTDTWHALDTAAGLGPNSPFDGTLLSYKNPVTGGSTFKTMDCRIQLLQPGEETKTHRHGGIVLHHVFRGSGSTIVDDTVLDWGDKDCFMLPSWRWHHHRNNSKTEPAILFTVTDRPALEAFDLYREEAAEA